MPKKQQQHKNINGTNSFGFGVKYDMDMFLTDPHIQTIFSIVKISCIW